MTSTGEYPSSRTGRLLVEGGQWRIDYEQPTGDEVRVHDTVLAIGGQRKAINHSNNTWYRLGDEARLGVIWSLFGFYRLYPSRALKSRIERTGNHTIEFRYSTTSEIDTQPVPGEVWGRIVVVSAGDSLDSFQPLWLLFDIDTHLPDVNQELRKQLAALNVTPREIEMTINRRLDGGRPMKQVIRAAISSVRSVPTRAADFEVPAGYRYQEPVISGPGH